MNFYSEECMGYIKERNEWKARALKAEAECTEQRHRAQDAESALLKAEAALREIIGLYVGSNPEMARARDIARAALLQGKEE